MGLGAGIGGPRASGRFNLGSLDRCCESNSSPAAATITAMGMASSAPEQRQTLPKKPMVAGNGKLKSPQVNLLKTRFNASLLVLRFLLLLLEDVRGIADAMHAANSVHGMWYVIALTDFFVVRKAPSRLRSAHMHVSQLDCLES